jgi:RimJ/RimL family protein N-acetyltransferase
MSALEILTPRLLLRPPVASDFEGWVQFASEPETMRFLGGVRPPSGAWRAFMTMAGAWHLEGFAMFSVIDRDSGRWIGRIGPWQPEGWPGTEVGWGLLQEYVGRGLAEEASIASIDWAFAHLGWSEVIHCISPDNLASQRLATRLGAYNDGPTKLPPPYDSFAVNLWRQSRAEWNARPRPTAAP